MPSTSKTIGQEEIRKLAQSIEEKVVALRREFHATPEIGFQEVQTAARISSFLSERGIEHRTGVAKTGVLATIRGRLAAVPVPGSVDGPAAESHARGSRAVLLRADMDCLPLQESNDVPYKSRRDGFMHACGHDGHVAILLCAADLLARLSDRFSGTVRLAFQPGEEGYGGAVPLIEQGALADPDCEAAFGLHMWNSLPAGTIGVREGAIMASVDEFRIRITGRGGHGAEPFDTKDPIVTAAHIVTAFQSIVARNIDALDAGVVTVGAIHSGTTHNIIPETAELIGTLRSFKPEIRELLRLRVREIAESIAVAFGCRAEVELHSGYPATVNDDAMARFARTVAMEVAGAGHVTDSKPVMGGEDFSYFLQKVPGAFVFLGSNNPAKGFTSPHHSPYFDFDEESLPLGVELMTSLAIRYLESAEVR